MEVPSIDTVRDIVAGSLDPHPLVVLAVSGGMDSTVLLDAAAARRRPESLVVATFDHGTGDAARSAVELVRLAARRHGIDCVAGRARGAASETSEPASEAAWREARWRFLHGVAAAVGGPVATAHTADDQIETVLMRLFRGAGARGLASLEAGSDILRPLLPLRREAVAWVAARRRLAYAEDPSNRSLRHLRNRVRHEILPALRRADATIDDTLLDIGRRAAAWRAETESLAARVSRLVARDAVDLLLAETAELDRELLAIIWPAVAGRVGATLDWRGIGRVAAFTAKARVGARMPLSGGWEVVRSREALQLRRSSRVDESEAALHSSCATSWGDWTFAPEGAVRKPRRQGHAAAASGWEADLPADEPLRVRAWRPGDRFGSDEVAAGKKVKRLLLNAGITGHERAGWPVVLCGERIVWIPGVRRSDAATVRSGRPSQRFTCARLSR